MMLNGESRAAQTVFLCACRDAPPIHMRGDVRVANLLERRNKKAMFRANLQRLAEFIARISIIDHHDVTTLQLCRDVLDPIECSLIDRSALISGSLDKNKSVSIKINQFFPAGADQAHRHRVE